MRREEFRQAFRLRLLALVLALALTWYVMNPAPSSVRQVKQKEGQPDEERREVQPPMVNSCDWGMTESVTMKPDAKTAVENIDDLEWPEVIETR
ncbi:MAG TPA: hypothetical protein VGW12_00225 [Pyrinomonadaceae bacterium]|nr:hypothetical protein [Pyrinomonadaceae bacterium]